MNEFFASNTRNDGMHSRIEIKVDLPRLITDVVVGPEVEPMQSSKALMESVTKNLGCKITSSTLLAKPY